MTDDIDRDIEKLVGESARRSFGPGFADRVMLRVRAEADSFDVALLSQFRWLAAAASLAAVALGAYSILGAERYETQSALEAALGLEPVSAETVYSLEEALYGIAAGSGEDAS